MKARQYISILLTVIVLGAGLAPKVYAQGALTVPLGNVTQTELDLHAPNALVVDVQTGALLYEKNAQARISPVGALCTLMTAMLTMQDEPDTLVVTQEQLATVQADTRKIGLRHRDTPSRRDLLAAMLLHGAQDAAAVLALFDSTAEQFVARMNEQAQALGMVHTQYSNYDGGSSDAQQYSTLEDLALLLMEATGSTSLMSLLALEQYAVEADHISGVQSIVNRNAIMRAGDAQHDARVIGALSGATSATGANLALYAQQNGMKIAIILAGAQNNATAYADAKTLLDYTFDTYERQDLTQTLATIAQSLSDEQHTYALAQQDIIATVHKTTFDAAQLSLLPQGQPDHVQPTTATVLYADQAIMSVALAVESLAVATPTPQDADQTPQPVSTDTPNQLFEPMPPQKAAGAVWLYWVLGGLAVLAVAYITVKKLFIRYI